MPETRLSSEKTSARRLEQLRKQVYGLDKQSFSVNKSTVRYVNNSNKLTTQNTNTSTSDTVYLRQDLTKIAILSFSVLALQFLLYFAFKNNLLNI